MRDVYIQNQKSWIVLTNSVVCLFAFPCELMLPESTIYSVCDWHDLQETYLIAKLAHYQPILHKLHPMLAEL